MTSKRSSVVSSGSRKPPSQASVGNGLGIEAEDLRFDRFNDGGYSASHLELCQNTQRTCQELLSEVTEGGKFSDPYPATLHIADIQPPLQIATRIINASESKKLAEEVEIESLERQERELQLREALARISFWKRPEGIARNPRLFCGGNRVLEESPMNVERPPNRPSAMAKFKPGAFDDAWFWTAVGMLASHQPAFEKVFLSAEDGRQGMYSFQFYQRRRLNAPGNRWSNLTLRQKDQVMRKSEDPGWRSVVVDDQLPMVEDGKQALGGSDDPDEMWPGLLQKAFAKFLGSYSLLHGGDTAEAIVALTGGSVRLMNWDTELVSIPATCVVWWLLAMGREFGLMQSMVFLDQCDEEDAELGEDITEIIHPCRQHRWGKKPSEDEWEQMKARQQVKIAPGKNPTPISGPGEVKQVGTPAKSAKRQNEVMARTELEEEESKATKQADSLEKLEEEELEGEETKQIWNDTAVSVLEAIEIIEPGPHRGSQIVKLRDCFGKLNWRGDWGWRAPADKGFWTKSNREALAARPDEYICWMKIADVVRQYNSLLTVTEFEGGPSNLYIDYLKANQDTLLCRSAQQYSFFIEPTDTAVFGPPPNSRPSSARPGSARSRGMGSGTPDSKGTKKSGEAEVENVYLGEQLVMKIFISQPQRDYMGASNPKDIELRLVETDDKTDMQEVRYKLPEGYWYWEDKKAEAAQAEAERKASYRNMETTMPLFNSSTTLGPQNNPLTMPTDDIDITPESDLGEFRMTWSAPVTPGKHYALAVWQQFGAEDIHYLIHTTLERAPPPQTAHSRATSRAGSPGSVSRPQSGAAQTGPLPAVLRSSPLGSHDEPRVTPAE